jgi:hypothetical protein
LITSSALVFRHLAQRIDQLIEIRLIARTNTCIPRRVNAGRAVQRVDLDTRVIRDGRQSCSSCSVACFQNRVLDEAQTGFFGGCGREL